jgi:uncharacterized protein (DUF2252 family)
MSANKKLLLHNRDQKIMRELHLNNEEIGEKFKQEKFQKMSASPYAFYRGSNHLYWEDFYNDWRISFFGGTSSTLTWINGDAHVYNYGAYANHYGEAIFCMDDFDDAIVADYQFDLWRMAISILLDCRDNGVFEDLPQKKALNVFAQAYLDEMSQHNDDDPNNEVHLTKATADGLLRKFLKKVEKKKSRLKMLEKWTTLVDGKRVFDDQNEKLARLSTEEYQKVEKALSKYKNNVTSKFDDGSNHFIIKDIAKRVKAGTGSLGSARYYILLEADSDAQDDDVILDMKEQGKPPLYTHMSPSEKKEYDLAYPIEGERHALAFLALAEHADRYLGWTSLDDVTFSIKERSPYKCDFPTEKLKKPKHLYFMANIWGTLLASRHKRASYRLNDDAHEMPIAFKQLVDGKHREFKALVSSVALRYADRVKDDYRCFMSMVADAE